MTYKKNLMVYCDGGARGNPGPAAIGFLVYKDGRALIKDKKLIGRTTNNVAEYRAVIEALAWLLKNLKGNFSQAKFYIDSLLIVNQLNGLYKIKDAKLRALIVQAKGLEQELRKEKKLEVVYTYISREKNFQADRLVNLALDQLQFS